MNLNVRNAVIHNINQLSNQELHELVQESVQEQEEKLLPGLGVIFEKIWQNSTPDNRNEMIQTLQQGLR